MAKKKNTGTTKQQAQQPVCKCTDPYKCSCSNRPARPSTGHKWDSESQSWVGKGHRQKGGVASGHTLKQSIVVTEKGQTKIAPHQSLPSKLLSEFCKREKRPEPIFTQLPAQSDKQNSIQSGNSNKLFKYRCLVPDSKKNSDKDLIFIPSHPCSNEEQAQEESALLALLKLTPSLPHERKLPEPYRSTWLHATTSAAATAPAKGSSTSKQLSQRQSSQSADKNQDNENNCITAVDSSTAAATATKNLRAQTSYTSEAERRKQEEQKRQEWKMKHYKHEAIRMANQDHPCFMSAIMRKRIETFLRGDSSSSISFNDAEEDNADDPAIDDDNDSDEIRSYVVGRLRMEGFTPSQARKAYTAIASTSADVSSNSTTDLNEEQFDKIHDQCLQWLCINLNEDQLPEGFNPSGQTLDVLLRPAKATMMRKTNSNQLTNDDSLLELKKKYIDKYGLTDAESSLIFSKASAATEGVEKSVGKSSEITERAIQRVLWNALCCASGVSTHNDSVELNETHSDDVIENRNLIEEEFEALSAIFSPCECNIEQSQDNYGTSIVSLSLPNADVIDDATLTIYIQPKRYPINEHPIVFVSGRWKRKGMGVYINMEVIKFLFGLHLGEPMVYAMYGFASNLVQNCSPVVDNDDKLPSLVLFLRKGEEMEVSVERKADNNIANEDQRVSKNTRDLQRRPFRPREKSDFWSKPPHFASPAVMNPNVKKEIVEARKKLPAAKTREEFLSLLRQSEKAGQRVSLVTGATGCGKSTQLAQFILEDQPANAKIVVTQPRRLAATGVASRVAVERGEGAPGVASVGYAVRGEVKCNRNTRLLFCTTGVLLRQMQSDGALENITHIVIDECHERNLDTDILLGLLKSILPSLPHLKVILMSATMEAEKFATYYGESTPRMHIPGFTYPITDNGLEDVLQLTGYIPRQRGKSKKRGSIIKSRSQSSWDDSERSEHENDVPDKHDGVLADEDVSTKNEIERVTRIPVADVLKRMAEDEIDYDLIAVLIRHLIQTKEDDGSILVFLPGAPEISFAAEIVKKVTKGMLIELLPLHGGLQPNEQNLVFRKAAAGFTKVILSTNVAETSITIPDCTCVIDSCREKQSSYDPVNRMPLLVERFASADSLKQRRGRAGRIRSGFYYQLISAQTKAKLLSHGIPEICRCALDSAILSMLYIGVEDGKGSFLKTLLDPPPQDSIDASIHSLFKLKAAEALPNGCIQLTPLGVHLAGIPAPPVVGKLIVTGSILGCRTSSLAVAAFMSLGRSPFLNIDLRQRSVPKVISETAEKSLETNEDEDEERRKRIIIQERSNIFKIVGNSDHALIAYVFLNWMELQAEQQGGNHAARKFCDALGLSYSGMRDMKQLVLQYDSSLASIGFAVEGKSDANSKSWRVVRSCIVAALSPSQLVRVQRPVAKYNETLSGSLERDAEAKEVKFYVRVSSKLQPKLSDANHGDIATSKSHNDCREERVFFHPSSFNFGVGKFSCPWLVFHDLVRTSKPFLRGATECSAYALLLFGGDIEVQASKNLIVVDNWVRLSASARIGALVGGLRQKVDDLLLAKVANPTLNITESDEMKLVIKLLIGDGLYR